MRTLKKSLALVLALVMVLGLGVVGASADNALDDFTDANTVGDAYLEAMGVMTGLGVIDGVGTAAPVLDPDGTYTREQAAKIITYLLLGKENAEALTATDTPFTDVPEGSWAAKYISYCVEKGIIDGMTPTTFEPYATLTGFQWAKMLLSAVGFGANGEFVGDSWSFNTASIASQVKLFNGDLSGGDHKPLQRQQAILYAFNALTGVPVVVYSAALGDYILYYNVNDVSGIDRFTYEGTLAANVYDLYSVTGIVNRTEGAGFDLTAVGGDYVYDANDIEIDADLDLDMLYHAARIWYVPGTYAGERVAVYTHDLAKVTSYDCDNLDDGAEAADKLTGVTDLDVGTRDNNSGATLYEYNIIDNTALSRNNYAAVSYYYSLGSLGTKHADGVDVLCVGGREYNRQDYDNVWTNIDSIERNDRIVFIRTWGDHATYHVYALTSTSGTVSKVDNVNKEITLTDGTVLDASVFADAYDADFVDDDPVVGVTYTFTLDSHGHFIDWSADAYGQVVYYTGTCRSTSAHDAWSADYEWAAQCVNVETGEPVEVPVTTDWKDDNDDLADAGYYDITNTDEPVPYDGGWNPAYGKYMYKSQSVVFNTSDRVIENVWVGGASSGWEQAYINPNTVTFVIATGVGENMTTKTYTGVAALLKDYASADGINSITMSDLMITVTGDVDSNGDYTAVTVFAIPDYTSGGIIYFPADVEVNQWVKVEGGWEYSGGYLNGTKVDPTIFVENKPASTIDKGFYNFDVDTDGYWTLGTLNAGLVVDGAQAEVTGAEGARVLYDHDHTKKSYNLTDSTIVVDLREDVPSSEHLIDSVEDMVPGTFNEVYSAQLVVGFTYDASNNVTVIYITDDSINH